MHNRMPCALALLLPLTGAAQADSVCDRIAKAMLATSDQPSVRQRTYEGRPGKETIVMEAISLTDAMYVRIGDSPWRRTSFGSAKRRELAEAALKAMPLSECSGPSDGWDGAVPIIVFEYTQPNPLGSGAKSRTRIWIGRDDGLPRRLLLQGETYQTLEYGPFAAPTR